MNLKDASIDELKNYISACKEFSGAGGTVSWTDADGREIIRSASAEMRLAESVLMERLLAAGESSPEG